jgi:hypothetical protein
VVIRGDDGHVDISSTRSFVSIHARPVTPRPSDFPHRECSRLEPLTALVVQGPIVIDKNFTLNTLQLYRHQFPQSPIILSTWDDSPETLLRQAESLGCHVLASPKPPISGWGNINYQMMSTWFGIDFARSLGSQYVLKTRTDFRIHRGDALTNLHALLKAFPLKVKAPQEQRIIATDLATLKHRPYGLTDILQFGTVADMSAYWRGDTYEQSTVELTERFGNPPLVDGVPVVAEIFLCWRYLKSIGVDPDFSLEDWWSQLRDRFLIVDSSALDAFWFKYDWHWEYRFGHSYSERGPLSISHLDWLTLHALGVPESWTVNGFRERWVRADNLDAPTIGGISQVSL